MPIDSVRKPSESNTLEIMMYPEEVGVLQALVDALPATAVLVEFGSGGSTRFFADNLGAHRALVSVEHNRVWFEKVTRALETHPNGRRIEFIFEPPDFPAARYVFATPLEETPAGLQKYINPAISVPWKVVDFVLVDGVARGACLAALRTKLAPGTIVALHDYTGRENWYDWAVKLYDVVAGPLGRAGLLTLRVPRPKRG